MLIGPASVLAERGFRPRWVDAVVPRRATARPLPAPPRPPRPSVGACRHRHRARDRAGPAHPSRPRAALPSFPRATGAPATASRPPAGTRPLNGICPRMPRMGPNRPPRPIWVQIPVAFGRWRPSSRPAGRRRSPMRTARSSATTARRRDAGSATPACGCTTRTSSSDGPESVKLAQVTGDLDATPTPWGERAPTLSGSLATRRRPRHRPRRPVRPRRAQRSCCSATPTGHGAGSPPGTRSRRSPTPGRVPGLPGVRFHGSPLKLVGGRTTMREYDVPLDGFSTGGELYAFFTSNHFRRRRVMGRSVLARAEDPGLGDRPGEPPRPGALPGARHLQ